MIGVWVILGLALWAVLIGWAISPWLVLAGAVVFCLVLYTTNRTW